MDAAALQNAATTTGADPAPAAGPPHRRIAWYKTPVDPQLLKRLTRRSDFKGLVQTLGFLAVLAATGFGAAWSVGRLPWFGVVALVFLHGSLWPFLVNAHHELVHKTVFKTRALNSAFLYVVCFMHWLNPFFFQGSHTRHHQYTLHYPDDKEVVAPIAFSWRAFWKTTIVNPPAVYHALRGTWNIARGRITNGWMGELFPADDPAARRVLVVWSRILLVGHALIVVAALIAGWWMVPVLFTFAFAYGSWLQQLCNHTQHLGLPDQTPDYRVCCRTIYLNPLLRFLYWHMNFHTEHHMYAAVPCYNLGRLHRAVKHDLPPTPHGLVAAWRAIKVDRAKEALRLSNTRNASNAGYTPATGATP